MLGWAAEIHSAKFRSPPMPDRRRPLSVFTKAILRNWGDAMTGRQSAPFVILGAVAFLGGFFNIPYLNSEPLKTFVLFGQFSIVAIALFYTFFRVWRDEYTKKVELEERMLPEIGLHINALNRGILEIP